jgi:hypothetical protein
MSGTIQEVKIIEDRGSQWAKEVTLAALLKAVGNSNELLKAIGGEKTKNVDLRNLDRLTANAGRGARRLAEVSEATSDLRGKLLGMGRTVTDSSRQIARSSADLARSLDSTGGFMRTLSRAGEGVIGSVSRLGPAGAATAVAMTAVATAAGLMIDRVMASRDAFMGMTQAGLYFTGNSLEFAATVRESGLELRQFTQIAEKYNVALLTSAGAESGYLRQVRALGSTFDRLNMTIQDGSEYFAEFLDQNRLTNAAFMRDEQAQREAFIANANIQQELVRLTGVTVRQQREQARGVAASRQMQALMLSRPEDAARINRASQNIGTASGMNQQQLDELALFVLEGRALSGDLQRARALAPQAFAAFEEEFRSGGTEQSGRQLLSRQQEFGQSAAGSELVRFLSLMMQSTGMSGASALLMDIITRGRQIDLTRTGAEGGQPGQPIDAATRTVNEVISDFIRAIGSADATLIRASAMAINNFQYEIQAISRVLQEINPDNLMTVLNGIRDTLSSLNTVLEPVLATIRKIQETTGLGPLAQLGLGAGAVAGAGYLARKALRGGAPGAPGIPGIGSQSGPPSRPGFMRRMAAGALGLEQLLSAGSALMGGNFAQAGGHAALWFGRRTPAGMGVSAADIGVQALTGRGLVDRALGPGAPAADQLATLRERLNIAQDEGAEAIRQRRIEAALQQAELEARIRDMQYRQRPGENNEELTRSREQLERVVRLLEDLRLLQRQQ